MDPVTGGMMLASLAMQGASAGGLFGGPKMQGLTTDQKFGNFANRQAQIGNFADTLAGIRNRYKTQSDNFYNNAMGRFMPMLASKLGANGLNAHGGAFASVFGRQAAQYQDQENMNLLNLENSDSKYIDSQYAANNSALQGVPLQQSMDNPFASFANSASGSLMNYGLMNEMGLFSKAPSNQMSASSYGGPMNNNGMSWNMATPNYMDNYTPASLFGSK